MGKPASVRLLMRISVSFKDYTIIEKVTRYIAFITLLATFVTLFGGKIDVQFFYSISVQEFKKLFILILINI